MEQDRPKTSRSSERPVTRWRRESDSSENSINHTDRPASGVSRSYNKIERPISRRGIKADISEFGISRPPTSRNKSFSSRPPSSSASSFRAVTSGARLNTMSSATLNRIGSSLPRNTSILDRPVTQQGLVGVRPTSSKNASRRARQSQEKQYYQQMLEVKVQELTKEIDVLNREIEKFRFSNQDQRARNLNAELSGLQNQLTHYNIVLDKLKSESGGQEVREFADFTNQESMDSEPIFEKYQETKNTLNELQLKIDENGSIHPDIKQRHEQVLQEKMELERKIGNLRINLDQFSLENFKANDPLNRESDETKLNTNDTMDKLEKNLPDKKEEEIMDIFKSTFEKNRTEQLEKLNLLEDQITMHLEQISININESIDSNLLTPDEMEMLNTLMDQNFENRNEKSLEELRQESIRLNQIFNKLETLELKIRNRMVEASEKSASTTKDIFNNSQEESSEKNENEEKRSFLHSEKDYSKLKEKIEKNEIYRAISILEDKLKRISNDESQFSQPIEDQTGDFDQTSLIAKLLSLIASYNNFLINDVKSTYQTMTF